MFSNRILIFNFSYTFNISRDNRNRLNMQNGGMWRCFAVMYIFFPIETIKMNQIKERERE